MIGIDINTNTFTPCFIVPNVFFDITSHGLLVFISLAKTLSGSCSCLCFFGIPVFGAFKHVFKYKEVRISSLIFNRHEANTFCSTCPMPYQYKPATFTGCPFLAVFSSSIDRLCNAWSFSRTKLTGCAFKESDKA